METQTHAFKIRLGLFIVGGVALFAIAIFTIGKQKNLFDPVFRLTANFYNVGGLQAGNNVRLSGINVGTVNTIAIINDSTVHVSMLIKKNVQRFIRADCEASIGSEGIIGDRIVILSQGSTDAPFPRDGQFIASNEPVEIDEIMANMMITVDNTVIISEQLGEIVTKINNGNGILWHLIEDSTMAQNISKTIVSLKKSSKGLNENIDAAKDNFLLKGYFKKKKRAAQKIIDDAEKIKAENAKIEKP